MDRPCTMASGTYEEAKTFLRRPMPERRGGVDVNIGMIQQFCGLTEDANASYWDPGYATRRWGGIVSPPAMLLTWAMALDWAPGAPTAHPPLCLQVPLPGDTLINVSQAAEFTNPLRVGERLSMVETLVDLSEEKQTRLGFGHFVTTRGVLRTSDGAAAGDLTNVLFRFTASAGTPGPEDRPSPPAQLASEGGLEHLEGYKLHVPYCKVVTSPAATLDYFPVFWDESYARAHGHPTVFVNTMVLLGLIDRLVTDWAGPGTFITAHRLALLRPVYAGETVFVTGHVSERRGGLVIVDAEIIKGSGAGVAVCGRGTVTARIAE